MKQYFFVLFIFVSSYTGAQTQTLLGSGVDPGSIKRTFARSEKIYSYLMYKSYVKPSILIKDSGKAFLNGVGAGIGVDLTNEWNLGVSYHTLPYTQYRMSQVLLETGFDLLPCFSANKRVGVVAGFAFGPAFGKGMTGVNFSTRPSLSLKYKLTGNVSSFIQGEVNMVHYTSTKFLTYLAASVGISYVINIQKNRPKPIFRHKRIETDIASLLPGNRSVADDLVTSMIQNLNKNLVQISLQVPSHYSFTPEERRYVHINTNGVISEEVSRIIDMKRSFRNPIQGAKVISQYKGRRPNHHGIDLKLYGNDTIRAAFDGQVRLSKRLVRMEM